MLPMSKVFDWVFLFKSWQFLIEIEPELINRLFVKPLNSLIIIVLNKKLIKVVRN